MKKLLLIAVAAVCALSAQQANAQIFGGWFNFGVGCQSCRQATQQRCATCAGGVCQVETEPAQEYKPEPCEAVETCEDCPLSDVEAALVKEVVRVRGASRLRLKFDAACNRRAIYNANAQANACRVGHFSGDVNEVAAVGCTSAAAAVRLWMQSPAHRAILLRSNYCKVGASVRKGRDGRLYWSLNFGF